jgi:SAM-dependent methyltransferase
MHPQEYLCCPIAMIMILRKIFYTLPPQWRFWARKVYFAPIDIYESLLGTRHKYQPPKGSIYIGSGDFIGQGQHQLQLLIRHINLKPDDVVLDIGSGIGRTAVALTTFLYKNGRYEGFDVVKSGVDWCNQKIKKDFPNFNFNYVPLQNDLYNEATVRATEFAFPYASSIFSKAFLFSVFTHMQIEEIEHYLSEISRVLSPNGQCLASFFIFDDHSVKQLDANTNFRFPVVGDGYRLMDPNVKAANVAIHNSRLQSMAHEAGLKIEKIEFGYWRTDVQKTDGLDFQDMVVFAKNESI